MRSVDAASSKRLREVQVQSQVDVKADQIVRTGRETGRTGQATDCAESACRSKLDNASVHAGVDAIVVGADDDASRLQRMRRMTIGL